MNSDGIGFGLMISKALIEANGGRLEITSEGIDKGSVFQFTMKMRLPVADNEIPSGEYPSKLIKLGTDNED